MGLNGKKIPMGGKKGVEQEAIEAGTYPCRVVQVLDLGLQPQQPYQGEEKPPAHEIMITYEFLDEFCVDENGEELEDKPRWLSETMPLRNLDSDLAKSTKRYNALDPNDDLDGDFLQLVGIPCMVTVINKQGKGKNANKVYTNITNVSTMRPKEANKAPELVNPPKVFFLDEPDLEVLNSLPSWLSDKIKANLEFSGSALEAALNGAPAADEEEEEAPKPKKKAAAKKKPEPEDDDNEEDGDEPW